MIRNRAARYRNLQNLHVIPTAPTVQVVPFVQSASNVLITVQPTTSIPETPIKPTTSVPETPVKPTTSVPQTLVTSSQSTSNKNSQPPYRLNMYSQNNYRSRRPRRRNRNRKRKDVDRFSSMQTLVPNKNDDWYNSNDLNQESCPPSTDNTQENVDIENTDEKTDAVIEEAENYLEATGEEDFEEVEVASVDGEASAGEASAGEASAGEASVDADGKQEILVGFRTSKICYLSYKKKYFFKPKVYNFSSQRTFVNCLNVQDNCSVDVDVVSEADYDEVEFEGEILDQTESQDYVDKMEVDEKNVDNSVDVSMANDSDIKVDTKVRKENVGVKSIEDDPKLKNKGLKEIKNLDHKSTEKDPKSDEKIMKNSSPVDTKSAKSKISTDGKAKTNDSKGELNKSSKVSKLEVKSGKNELTGSNNQNKSKKSDVNKVLESSVKNESIQRIYKGSVENDDIHQGKCAIQSILDSWESHLIGLEYLIEIKNNKTNSSTMYNCILCSEDLKEKEFSSTDVISHINGRKHVVKFLEKHFPSCGIKLCDSSDCNFLVLQKICEEINVKLGYYYMCITNFDFYQNHKKEIIEIAQNASHSTEEHLKLSKNVFEKEVESNLSKEVKDVLSCVIKNVVSPEEISERESNRQVPKGLEITLKPHKPVEDSVPATSKTFYEEKKKLTNTFKKCKGNSSLTSFLKLKYAKAFKGTKPAKGPSTKAVKQKSSEIVGAVKEKSSEIAGAVKEKSSELVGSVKEITTAVVSAERENTENVGVVKEKNNAIASAKKEKTLQNNVAEEETVANEDPGVESTQPIYQTGIMNDGDSDSSIQILEIKDVQKPTGHSKYCRKRILGKDSRFKVAAKTKTKEEPISDRFNTASAKVVSVSESGNKSFFKKLVPKKDMGFSEKLVVSSSKNSSSRKVTSIPILKVSKAAFKSPFNKYSKSSHPKIVHKKENEALKQKIDILVSKDLSSKWKPVVSAPINASSSKPSHALKSVPKSHSPIPVKNSSVERIVRDLSRSPVRKIKSPLRIIHRSPVRKLHRSPVRRHSRSPFRRSSRSPYRKLSKSPPRRKSRSPKRHRSRSPLRRHSRSPLRRYSRSPVKRHSRSPVKRHSRSPIRRRSRSPVRRHSRSPIRRHSRSPVRRHSRSPVRRRSKSPVRRRSKSPVSRYSRSPMKWHSRSPSRRHSRSPRRRYSKSPVREHSFSPIRRPLSPVRRERSPVLKLSRSYNRSSSKSPLKEYRNIYKARSPSIEHSGSIKDRMISGNRFFNKYDIDKRVGQISKEYAKIRASKQSVSSISDKHKSHSFASSSLRGISDLDPVSDEDESVYFDKQQHLVEDIMASSSSKAVQFLQKFAASNPNLDPSTIKQMMQFFESHRDELQQMMGSSSTSKSEKININRQISANIQENILQQLLLSSFAGNSREPGPSPAPNLQPKYEQPQFMAENVSPGYGLMPNVSPHNLAQFSSPTRVFPPNVNMPPPQVYGQLNQPHQELLQKTPPQNEGLFKDIKVTINKLFGANEMAQKQENIKSAVPGYVFQPDPEKWDLNHPATPKFSPHSAPNFSGHLNPRFAGTPMDKKNMFQTESKNINFGDASKSSVMRPDMPAMFNRGSNVPGQFLRGLDRQAQNLPVPPPDAKVSFCEAPRGSSKGNLFPVVHNPQGNTSFGSSSSHAGVSDVKVSLAQRLASVLVKVGMTDVPAPLLQEMLMKIGAFSSLPRQDITEAEIISILKRLGYLS